MRQGCPALHPAVGHDAVKVSDLFKHADVLTEDMDIQLHAVPPRSRRNSSRVPDFPTSVKVSLQPKNSEDSQQFA